MPRRFRDQAVEELEAERQRIADQRDVRVRLVDRSPAGQRVAERVDRHLPHRAAPGRDHEHGRQQRGRDATGTRPDGAGVAFARRGPLHTLSAGLPLTPTLESVPRQPLIQRNLTPPRAENACAAASPFRPGAGQAPAGIARTESTPSIPPIAATTEASTGLSTSTSVYAISPRDLFTMLWMLR